MVVVGRVVAHPGDDRRPRPLLDGDALRPRDRAAADGRGEYRDDLGQSRGQFGIPLVEAEELKDGLLEILLVLLLLLLAPSAPRLQFPLVLWRLALGPELFGDAGRKALGDAQADAELLPPELSLHHPAVGRGRLEAARQRGVSRWHELPAVGHIDEMPVL